MASGQHATASCLAWPREARLLLRAQRLDPRRRDTSRDTPRPYPPTSRYASSSSRSSFQPASDVSPPTRAYGPGSTLPERASPEPRSRSSGARLNAASSIGGRTRARGRSPSRPSYPPSASSSSPHWFRGPSLFSFFFEPASSRDFAPTRALPVAESVHTAGQPFSPLRASDGVRSPPLHADARWAAGELE
jgi:hypothetical protein